LRALELSAKGRLTKNKMKKKLILLALLVLALGIGFFYLVSKGVYGDVVLHSKIFPYQVQFVSESAVESYECAAAECTYTLKIGDYDFFSDKEGYYAVQDSFSLDRNETYEISIELDVIPDLVESELTASDINQSLFDTCYDDNIACGLDDLFSMEKDSDTGYMALWEGEVRRATFTKGMEDSLIFVQPDSNGAVLYDLGSFDAYAVDFLENTRTYLFTLENLNKVMFVDGGYIVDAGDLYWLRDGELTMLPFNWGLDQVTYKDGRIYFLADASELGDSGASVQGTVIGSYDGNSVYIIADGLEVDIEGSIMASDDDSVYVQNGDKIFELRQ